VEILKEKKSNKRQCSPQAVIIVNPANQEKSARVLIKNEQANVFDTFVHW
jgi:hypothetical protein